MGILYLTRHGETEWNKLSKLQGKKDSPLTEKGKWQAACLGHHLEDTHIDHIYTSSSERAIVTAQVIRMNRDIPVSTLDSLMEISLGVWEGQTTHALKERFPEAFDAFWNKPERYVPVDSDGETFAEVQRRMIETVEDLMKKHINETILIVTHGISLKTLIARFEKRPENALFKTVAQRWYQRASGPLTILLAPLLAT